LRWGNILFKSNALRVTLKAIVNCQLLIVNFNCDYRLSTVLPAEALAKVGPTANRQTSTANRQPPTANRQPQSETSQNKK
jgi:hypothetical protein